MKNISIIGKFMVIMALFGAFSLGSAIYSGAQLRTIDQNYTGLLDKETAATLQLARSNRAMQELRGAINGLMLSRTAEDNAEALKALDESRAILVEYLDSAAAAMPFEPRIPALKNEVLLLIDNACSNAVAAGGKDASEADTLASQDIYRAECKPAFATAKAKFSALTDDITKIAEARSTDLTATSETTIMLSVAGVVLGTLVVMLFGFFAIRSWLVMPIRALSGTMGVLANGDFTATVDGGDRRDEVGTMAKAVQVFKDNGLRVERLAEEAESLRSRSEVEAARAAERDRVRAAEMEQATSSLAGGLKRMADGDLTVTLNEAFAGDFESLRSDFNAAVAQLRDTLNSVVDATGTIDSGSRELSHSAGDLSRRTEQQAAALEETAAALDQITANVGNSTKRALEARTVAVEANKAASESGGVVANAVDAMQRIEQSSNEISNIIGVIDEIAFQTNLLALNAGVEAARAGDAGKGFAVVAQEVRELAQRSAKAAKEIKELIRNSSAEVGNGVKLVRDTGEALKTIEGYVSVVNEHMDAIANSSQEQSVGLAQVNSAVNQMDQTTQQNAAMVEESTAASASLASESEKLRSLLARFQLGGGASRAAPSLAHQDHRPVASPARQMMGKVAKALGVGKAAAHAEPQWESF